MVRILEVLVVMAQGARLVTSVVSVTYLVSESLGVRVFSAVVLVLINADSVTWGRR